MAYVAVTGGQEAIEQSLRLLEIFRNSEEDISVKSIQEHMSLLIDKIMSEAGLYSREYTAPVSYTHLDVYKRQGLSYTVMGLRFRNCMISMRVPIILI